MIQQLNLNNIGPSPEFNLKFGNRLNVLTGDNGLGKSFILDIIWWTVANEWPYDLNSGITIGRTVLPTIKNKEAKIEFSFNSSKDNIKYSAYFNTALQKWTRIKKCPYPDGFVFYAMSDGSFAIWDSARNNWEINIQHEIDIPSGYVLSPSEIWDGRQKQNKPFWLCNGLIRDWAIWQKENGDTFELLKEILKSLSPSEFEILYPGDLTRISLEDVRDMPTLKMSYGQDVAIVHASSGIRRVIALAYLIVWCWDEHLKIKKMFGDTSEKKFIFLIDEVEKHLHPKWQRTILPSLLKIVDKLRPDADIQIICTTHSPIVMASLEMFFDNSSDTWLDFDLIDNKVVLTQRPYIRIGNIGTWLTSEAFDLEYAYSKEAEVVLREAQLAMQSESIDKEKAIYINNRLHDVLSEIDPFWLRWRFIAEKKGWFK